jgi:crossover junction endodeoxyribonuclease RusA
MRMSERELELHLKRHQKRKNQALEQSKQKNGVKVHEATQKA